MPPSRYRGGEEGGGEGKGEGKGREEGGREVVQSPVPTGGVRRHCTLRVGS